MNNELTILLYLIINNGLINSEDSIKILNEMLFNILYKE